jgi:hypothetical protein
MAFKQRAFRGCTSFGSGSCIVSRIVERLLLTDCVEKVGCWGEVDQVGALADAVMVAHCALDGGYWLHHRD